jgi:hypothetical protein
MTGSLSGCKPKKLGWISNYRRRVQSPAKPRENAAAAPALRFTTQFFWNPKPPPG